MIMGFILYMSLALCGFVFCKVSVTSDSVVCFSLNCGCGVLSCVIFCSWYWGIVWLVLCPTVIKKSLKALAISWGSVYVVLSYLMSDGVVLSVALEGIMELSILVCSFWSPLASSSLVVSDVLFALVIVF